ncbi:hypothetical protein LCGC14_1603490 [marine sediment metagenome]|uniref:Uncharacterized protein n=1 Tax=marine sediment metagenome TaxID=412755 RepID=A0A0F9IX14_9ZZZZ
MANEDFTTFTETDPGSVIGVTASRVTWTDIEARQDNTHVSLDQGVAFFDGNFAHDLTISLIASEKGASYSFFWSLTNDLDDLQGLIDNSKDALFVRCLHPNSPDVPKLRVGELVGGTTAGSGTDFDLTTGIIYYLTITRDETSGSFGTLVCKIYSDAARTTLLNTLTLNLNAKTDFRYVMVGQSYDATGGGGADLKKQTGYSEDLSMQYPSNAGIIWMEGSSFHGFDENGIERTYIHTDDVDDVAVNGATTDPISSNWAYDHENLLTTKGDLLTYDTALVRFPIGAGGEFLVPNSATSTGLEWVGIVTYEGVVVVNEGQVVYT